MRTVMFKRVMDYMIKNMFAYCLNNPVNSSDPTGKFAWIAVGALGFSTILQKNNASVTAFLIQ